MTEPRTIIATLLLALVASNGWWMHRSVDGDITHTYEADSFEATTELLNQVLAVLPVAVRPNAAREDVIMAARGNENSAEPFEKDGYVWVGQLGLQFDQRGKLLNAVTLSDPGSK